MVKEIVKLTKGNVIQLGLLLLLLGPIGYIIFTLIGFNNLRAGIASEVLLILLLFAWIFSYFFRVLTGKMTFMEQRKRYRRQYEQITDNKLQEEFDSMSDDEKVKLINDLDLNKNNNDNE